MRAAHAQSFQPRHRYKSAPCLHSGNMGPRCRRGIPERPKKDWNPAKVLNPTPNHQLSECAAPARAYSTACADLNPERSERWALSGPDLRQEKRSVPWGPWPRAACEMGPGGDSGSAESLRGCTLPPCCRPNGDLEALRRGNIWRNIRSRQEEVRNGTGASHTLP